MRKAIPAAVHLGLQVIAPQVRVLRALRQKTPRLGGGRAIADSVAVAHAAGPAGRRLVPGATGARTSCSRRAVDCLIIDDVV